MQFINRYFALVLAAPLLVGVPGPVAGQMVISRFTIDGGGGTNSSGGNFTLGGTIGQPDAGVLSGTGFTLAGGFWFGGGIPVSGVKLPVADVPGVFRVHPVSPNPVGERARIAFDLPAPTPVKALVFDASGRLVLTLVDDVLPAGRHERLWDRRDASGRAVSSGVFFLSLNAGSHRDCQKLVVVR
jgi:hypothetical protein